MNLAAIDIGSNAVRLLVSEAVPYGDTVDFTKLSLVRIPLRLGLDVFSHGFIGEEKRKALLKSMQAFKLLMDVYDIRKFRACATSAMRDSSNGQSIADEILQKVGIKIDIIGGKEEAAIIYDTHMKDRGLNEGSRLYIDVGGGSTELTLYSNGDRILQDSFDVGTIRMIHGQVGSDVWDSMKVAVKNAVKGIKPLTVIGSGGNINKLFSISKTKNGSGVTKFELDRLFVDMESMSVTERMHSYNLRLERAEVIVPAIQIYSSVMKWAGATEIEVPRIGLADGIIRELYYQ